MTCPVCGEPVASLQECPYAEDSDHDSAVIDAGLTDVIQDAR